MAQNLFWFYDIAIIGILLAFFYVGAKRGFMKSIVLVALLIASFIASWFVAEVGAPVIYDSLIKDKVISAFDSSIENVDTSEVVSGVISNGEFGVELSKEEIDEIIVSNDDIFHGIAGELNKNGAQDSTEDIEINVENLAIPEIISVLFNGKLDHTYVKNALETIGNATENIQEVVDTFLRGSKDSIAQAAEEQLVKPIVIWVIKILIMVVLFFILKLIINPVSNIFKSVNKIPIIGPINALLGGVLNTAAGLLVVYVIALLIKVAINVGGNTLIFLNNETVQLTKIFKYIYNFSL